MPTIYSVKSDYLLKDADEIERSAKESLKTWILLGQTEKYSEAMRLVRALRDAAETRSLYTRREILRNAGFSIKSPKQTAKDIQGQNRKANPMKKPTPAQLAARARFAEMARSGAFKKKAAKARKAKANPAKKTVSQKISQLVHEGYPQKQAVAVALSEQRKGKVKRNPAKINWKRYTDEDGTQLQAKIDGADVIIFKVPEGEASVYEMPEWTKYIFEVVPDSAHISSQYPLGSIAEGKDNARGFVAHSKEIKAGQGRNRNPATGRKGSRTKLNPVEYRDIAQGVAPARVQYAVHMPDRPSYQAMAYFTKKADALEAAQEVSDRIGKPIAVSRVQVHFGPL